MNRGGVFDSSALQQGVFTVQADPAAAQQRRQHLQATRAVKVVARQHARFAGAETQLQQLLPAQFQPGESWNILSAGDIDALSYVRHIMHGDRFEAVILACWAISRPAIEFLAERHQAGAIKRIDAYVGDIMPRDRPDLHTLLCDLVGTVGGRVLAFKNHAKLWMFLRADGHAVTMQTSANPNYNRRCEQTVITASAELAACWKEWFDAIALPTPTFPNWTPYAWPGTEAQRAQTH